MNRVLLIGIITLTIFSCKKKEFDYTSPETYLAGDVSKNWYLAEYYINDIPRPIDACKSDNKMVLVADKTFQIIGGSNVCFVGEPNVIESGEWRVSSDDKTFYLFGINAFGYEANIELINDTRLELVEYGYFENHKYVYIAR